MHQKFHYPNFGPRLCRRPAAETSELPRYCFFIILFGFAFASIKPALSGDGHWVTTWGCGPQLTESHNLPPAPLANSTLRQFVHVTLGGKHLRIRFSNAYGTNSVAINSAHVALSVGGGSVSNGQINPAPDKSLSFHGTTSVNMPPGETIFSDPFDFDLPALTNLAISIYFGNISRTTINGHPGSRTTSYILNSNFVSSAEMT